MAGSVMPSQADRPEVAASDFCLAFFRMNHMPKATEPWQMFDSARIGHRKVRW